MNNMICRNWSHKTHKKQVKLLKAQQSQMGKIDTFLKERTENCQSDWQNKMIWLLLGEAYEKESYLETGQHPVTGQDLRNFA